ncbi:hypothetical protein C8R43DRAFT_942844 [Mycena crocata]|nr:hypothetical protein C8R43DRAFT_942844 [Mycena crocata]
MCLHKSEGNAAQCPCPRYMPQDSPQPGPQLCRDCEHWESLHAPPEKTHIADLMARIKPQIEKARQTLVSDDEARRESNTGFKKVSEEHKGRGGLTKYQKKDKSSGSKSSKAAGDDKSHVIGNFVLIPDAHFPDPEASDGSVADDVRDMGVAPVPSVTRAQALKDGGLSMSEDGDGGQIIVKESWCADHIDKLLRKVFPHVWIWLQKTHQRLEDGSFYWVLLSPEWRTLREFIKKGPITGADLLSVVSGKGKRPEQKTIYFALRFNVPSKIWTHSRWLEPSSDADFESPSKTPAKGKGKVKVQPKPLSTRQSTRKAVAIKEEDEHSVIEVNTDSEEDSASASEQKTPVKVKREQVRIKLEPELAAIAKTDSLFLGGDSDSDDDFPELLSATPSNAPGSIVTSSDATSASTSTSTSGGVPSLPAIPASSVATGPAPATSSVAASSSQVATGLFGLPRGWGASTLARPAVESSGAQYGGSASVGSSRPWPGTSSSMLASFSHPGPSSYAAASSSRSGPSSYASASSSSRSFPLHRSTTHHEDETRAMEDFNEFGNYREAPPKRTFDTAFFGSSGLKSPERTSFNPWKRDRKSLRPQTIRSNITWYYTRPKHLQTSTVSSFIPRFPPFFVHRSATVEGLICQIDNPWLPTTRFAVALETQKNGTFTKQLRSGHFCCRFLLYVRLPFEEQRGVQTCWCHGAADLRPFLTIDPASLPIYLHQPPVPPFPRFC